LKAQKVARMGFLDWNLKTNEMYWSDEIYKLYGVSRQHEKSNIDRTMELVHPDDLEFVEKNLDMAIQGVKKYDIDHRKLRSDGKVIWVHAQAELVRDAEGNPENLLGTVIDITERKQAEEALRESEEKYRTVVESSSDAILMLDTGRNIISCNQAFMDFFGYDRIEIEGRSTRMIHLSDEKFQSFGDAAYPEIERSGSYRTEWEFIRKDGSIFPAEAVTSVIKSPNELAERYVAIIRDTTERTSLESQLRQAQKMESIGTLAGGIAHDFNNILAAIIGFTELSIDQVEQETLLRDNLQEVLIAGKRAKELVQQILTFSRQADQETKAGSGQTHGKRGPQAAQGFAAHDH